MDDVMDLKWADPGMPWIALFSPCEVSNKTHYVSLSSSGYCTQYLKSYHGDVNLSPQNFILIPPLYHWDHYDPLVTQLWVFYYIAHITDQCYCLRVWLNHVGSRWQWLSEVLETVHHCANTITWSVWSCYMQHLCWNYHCRCGFYLQGKQDAHKLPRILFAAPFSPDLFSLFRVSPENRLILASKPTRVLVMKIP